MYKQYTKCNAVYLKEFSHFCNSLTRFKLKKKSKCSLNDNMASLYVVQKWLTIIQLLNFLNN